MLAILALLFIIGAPIYAFIYPSLTSMFFAGMAVMLLIEAIVGTSRTIRARNALRGLQAYDQMAQETVKRNEATKH